MYAMRNLPFLMCLSNLWQDIYSVTLTREETSLTDAKALAVN